MRRSPNWKRWSASRSGRAVSSPGRGVFRRAGGRILHGFDRGCCGGGDANGAPHPDPAAYAKKFSGKYAHRLITGGIGHNLPQEAPQAFAQAVIDVAGF